MIHLIKWFRGIDCNVYNVSETNKRYSRLYKDCIFLIDGKYVRILMSATADGSNLHFVSQYNLQFIQDMYSDILEKYKIK